MMGVDDEIARGIVAVAREFHGRGWLMGASGVDKGELSAQQVIMIDEEARLLDQYEGKPSDESLLHVCIAREHGAGAILHTHSVWNTIFSDIYAKDGGVRIEGYEMLKGLAGVRTHEHSEWLPIVENSQDIPALAETVSSLLNENPHAHGFLIRRHGLYSWGDNLAQAKRHVEILEFLMETMGRTIQLKG